MKFGIIFTNNHHCSYKLKKCNNKEPGNKQEKKQKEMKKENANAKMEYSPHIFDFFRNLNQNRECKKTKNRIPVLRLHRHLKQNYLELVQTT